MARLRLRVSLGLRDCRRGCGGGAKGILANWFSHSRLHGRRRRRRRKEIRRGRSGMGGSHCRSCLRNTLRRNAVPRLRSRRRTRACAWRSGGAGASLLHSLRLRLANCRTGLQNLRYRIFFRHPMRTSRARRGILRRRRRRGEKGWRVGGHCLRAGKGRGELSDCGRSRASSREPTAWHSAIIWTLRNPVNCAMPLIYT